MKEKIIKTISKIAGIMVVILATLWWMSSNMPSCSNPFYKEEDVTKQNDKKHLISNIKTGLVPKIENPNCGEIAGILFSSYENAIETIRQSDFNFVDRIETSESSWIKSAEFYSCDGETGYFIFSTTSGRNFIHSNVPAKIWKGFKSANSHGGYYIENIKKRDQLQIQ